jgi:daunosaminyl-N,N-dimethyltransferase/N-dimethyltransferase
MNQLYSDRAALYDLIYHAMPYAERAAELREVLSENGVGDHARVLEAACGTGNYLAHLRDWYEVRGFDLSQEMVAIARAKLPDVPIHVADMRDFSVEEPADAVLCLFSSIGYMRDLDELERAHRCFARALRPGGVLLVEPWLAPEDLMVGQPFMQTYEDADTKICRMSVGQRDGDVAVLDMHWLVGRRDAEVEHFVDRHELWMPTREMTLEVMAATGFDGRYEPEGATKQRGLFVGIRR